MEWSEVKGRIFDIQRFSVHDGPGIRSIVFLKGCRLRCRWCCNPESQEYNIQTMDKDGKIETVGRDVTVAEVLKEVEKDRVFYRRSFGGMTLSGGETMCQPDFAEALFREAHERGINTAIETTACASEEVVKRLVPHIDTVMMDIKHMDSEKHYAFTGQHNELMLKNARVIAEMHNDLIIRVPVVPTFNDTEEEIRAIAEFAATLPGVTHLHLLPYHAFGTDKYRWLGRPYTMSDIETPSNEHMNRLLAVVKAAGLNGQIGG
ncbi:MAG: glycyl-radical enzyme activating protein [Clostridia bacterium]|nr:glycyl-radical enzyme activating protein [Clostridia bacterium]